MPNSGDDDGVVDTVFFIHPESGSECDEGTNIWSHSFQFSKLDPTQKGRFVTNDIQKNGNGQPKLNADGTAKKILVEDYTIQPGLACGGNKIVEVGVFCHEYGHALGLPDFYDRTPNAGADSEGLGRYCLMAAGSYGGDGAHSKRPTEMSAWAKYYLGWSSPTKMVSSELQELQASGEGNEAFRLDVPGTEGLEYFLVEYRRNGPVQGHTNWDEFLPSSGLAVWHVDERVGANSQEWPFANPDQGQNDSPVRLASQPPSVFRLKHPLLALIQFDRQMNLEGGIPPLKERNRGDGSDLMASGTFADDPTGIAGSRAYDGAKTGIGLSNVTISGGLAKVNATIAETPDDVIAAIAAAPPALETSTETKTLLEDLAKRISSEPSATLSEDEVSRVGRMPKTTVTQWVKNLDVAKSLVNKAQSGLSRTIG